MEKRLFTLQDLARWCSILEQWGINYNNLSAFIEDAKKHDTDKTRYTGFSKSRIRAMFLGEKTKPDKIRRFKDYIGTLFMFDFDTELSSDDVYRLRMIEEIKKWDNPKYIEIKAIISLDMAKRFCGLYLGVVKFMPSQNPPSPYLFRIAENGSVEVCAIDYYRRGVIVCNNFTVYFYLNTAVGSQEPEMYLTQIPASLKGSQAEVFRFKMCGAWLTRDSKPAFGSTILVRQEAGSEIGKLLKQQKNSFTKLGLKFFKDLAESTSFLSLSKEVDHEQSYVYELTSLQGETAGLMVDTTRPIEEQDGSNVQQAL